MTKVERGILINEQHLYNVIHDIPEKVSFKDQIIELGYESIEAFFNEKAIYEMQQLLQQEEIYDVAMPNLVSYLYKLIAKNKYGIVHIYTDETCVCHGNNLEKPLNTEYCLNHEIPIYPYDSFGGNIVATKEDFGLAILLPTNIDISLNIILNKIKNILNNFYENVEIEGNDILINNKKVIGSGSFGNDITSVILLYFSMQEKNDLILEICGEPTSGKQPGYIDLPTEQLYKEVLLWLQGL